MIYDLRFEIRYLLIGLLVYLLIGLFLPTASGQTMSNQNYIIKTEELNVASDTPSNQNNNSISANENMGNITSEGVNFKVRTGFENIASNLPFSVSLSSDIVDFGNISPTNPIIRTVNLNVFSSSPYGYSVIASEDHALKKDDIKIEDVTCDNGECSQEKAGVWINTLTYGFGYRCDNITGDDCNSSFSNAEGTPSGLNFYKHFADVSNAQSPQSVMSGIGSKNKDVRLSYKVNISGNLAQGIYSNIITYIAVPNF